MFWEVDQTRLFACCSADRLTNPPCCICAKVAPALVIEFFGGSHQTQVSFLDKIDQGNAGAGIAARDSNYQAQIRLDQLAAGPVIPGCRPLRQVDLFRMCQQAKATNVAQVTLKSILSPCCLFGCGDTG